jgi:hypothetical protein
MVALADSAAARKLLLHGAATDAAAVGMSFGLDGLWQLIAGLFSGLVHLLLLPFQAIAHGFQALGHAIQALFAGLGTVAHLLVQAAVAGIGHGFDGMWHAIQGFFASIVAALAGAAHGLVLPFEAFWRWLQTAAGGTGSGFQGLWQNVLAFFATLAGAAHDLVHPFEAFWKWLRTAAADAAADISFRLDGLWPLVKRLYASLLATLAGAAHELAPRLESFWRWLRAAAGAALPYVLVIAAVLCVAALVWLSWPFLLHAAVQIGQALVSAVSSGAHYLFVPFGQCCVPLTMMRAPGAAGLMISRAAFESLPELYFQILRSAGRVVAAAVFRAPSIARACAAPVAALFGASS